MKILEVTNVDFSLRHFLLPLMRGLRQRGHEVVGVCAEGPLLDLPRSEGFRIIPAPMARSLNPFAQLRCLMELVRIFRQEKPDLVHAHMPISGLLARAAAHIAGVPHIAYTCHGFLFNQPGPAWRQRLSLMLERAAGRITGSFFTVSGEEAEDAMRLRIHPAPVPVLNGRDPARFRPDPETRARIRAELGASETDCVIIAVSRLVRHKGYRELLQAMQGAPRSAMLWVVGERLPTDHGPDLERDFAEAAVFLGPRLLRLGYRHDIASLLAGADIFCLPSHFEGLPMSIIEAMLTGLPVVATNIRGPREQVLHGVTGLLVPPMQAAHLADALGQLVHDPELRAAMGRAGRERALEHFDETKIVSRTVALLEQAVSQPEAIAR